MWTLIQSIKQTLSSYPFSQTWTFFFFTSSSAKLIPTLHEQPILPKKRNKINVSLLVTIFKDTSTVLKVRRCGYSPCSVVWNAVSWSPKTAGGSLRKDRSGRSGTDRQTDRQTDSWCLSGALTWRCVWKRAVLSWIYEQDYQAGEPLSGLSLFPSLSDRKPSSSRGESPVG